MRTQKTIKQLLPVLFSLAISVSSGCSTTSSVNDNNETTLLANYLQALWGTQISLEEQQRQHDATNMRREELIAQCMLEAGFEYIPKPPENNAVTLIAIGEHEFLPDDRDWVSQFGYGLVNAPWNRSPVNVNQTSVSDPNTEIVQSLSQIELVAYQAALWGTVRSESTSHSGIRETSGCFGWAQSEIQASDPMILMESEEFAPLFEAISELYASINLNPEFIQLNYEWVVCMADEGHPGFERQSDAQKMAAAQTLETGIPIDPTSPIRQTMADQEVELALADLGCREQTRFRDRLDVITTAAETQFVNDHRAELEALRSAGEQIG